MAATRSSAVRRRASLGLVPCSATSRADRIGARASSRPRNICMDIRRRATHLNAPTVALVSDSVSGGSRHVAVRVNAPRGTTAIVLRVSGVTVSQASIDGRIVDTTRFRRRQREWSTEYWNVPVEGAVFAFQIPAGEPLTLDLSARRPGLPAAMRVVARPDSVVASQEGDVSVVYRRARF